DDAPPGAWTVRDLPSLFSALARLEVRGVPINWRAFDAIYPRRRVDVPTYPFQRERFWFERGVAQSQRACSYQIKWRDAPAERSPTVLGPYVVVAGDSPDALAHKQRIEKQLASRGASLDEAARTAIFLASGPWRSDLQRLLKLVQGGTRVHLITVHAQPVGDREVDPGAAALWGFGRTVALEHRERWGQMIDLGSVQDLSAAVDEILSAATDD